jgi:hypothetical protein
MEQSGKRKANDFISHRVSLGVFLLFALCTLLFAI